MDNNSIAGMVLLVGVIIVLCCVGAQYYRRGDDCEMSPRTPPTSEINDEHDESIRIRAHAAALPRLTTDKVLSPRVAPAIISRVAPAPTSHVTSAIPLSRVTATSSYQTSAPSIMAQQPMRERQVAARFVAEHTLAPPPVTPRVSRSDPGLSHDIDSAKREVVAAALLAVSAALLTSQHISDSSVILDTTRSLELSTHNLPGHTE